MSLLRRDFIKAASALPGLTLPSVASAGRKCRPGCPNILVILVDQMNIDAISAYRDVFRHKGYNCHWLETPNLDRMVQAGTSFIESHSTDPICSPARASLWTGRMSCEHGVIYNNTGIDKKIPNFAQWLEQCTDYRRIYCGKWHAGGAWNCPEISGPRKIPGFETLPVGSYGNGRVMDYQVSTSVEAFLQNYDGESPFLMVAGLLNPHDCCFWIPQFSKGLITTDSDYYDLGADLPDLPPNHAVYFDNRLRPADVADDPWDSVQWKNYLYDYVRQVETLDRDVGRMLKAVEARSDDTIVVFTSDHGDENGRHHRLGKWSPHEASVKVPLIFSGRGICAGQVDRQHLVSHVDLVPTLCDLIGIEPPPQSRGFSLRPLLEGRGVPEWRDDVYYSFNYTGRVIRTQRYKYVSRYEFSSHTARPQHLGAGAEDLPFIDCVSGKASRFVPGQSGRFKRETAELLFDLQSDPWEMQNLAGRVDCAEVLQEHRQRLEKWEACLEIGTRFDRN